jgi:hypothetical protein
MIDESLFANWLQEYGKAWELGEPAILVMSAKITR